MRTLTAALLVLTLTALTPNPATAQPGEATEDPEALAAQAAKKYEADQLDDALELFRRAYKLSKDPRHLYAMAKIELKLHDCPAAVAHLQQFLSSKPGPKATAAAKAEIATCDEELGSSQRSGDGRETPEKDPKPPTIGDSSIITKRPISHAPPWYTDRIGMGLTISGGVALAAGGALFAVAYSKNQDAGEATNKDAHDRLASDAKRYQLYSIISAAAGGALIAGGVVRFMTRDTEPTRTVTIGPVGRGGWGIAFGGRF